MSQSAAQATAFYQEVAAGNRVWTIKDADGHPAPMTDQGRAMPFWSSRARVDRIVRNVPAYREFTPVELTWEKFRDQWLPGLERDDLRVGLNWTGANATGYDLLPADVRANIETAILINQPNGG